MAADEEHTKAQKVGAIVLGLLIMSFAAWFYLWVDKQQNGINNTLGEITASYRNGFDGVGSDSPEHPFVYVQGVAESGEELVDDLFQIQVQGVFFKRTVMRLTKDITHRPEGGRSIVGYKWIESGENPFLTLRLVPSSLRVAGYAVSSQLLDWPIEGEMIPCNDWRIGRIPYFREQPLVCRSDGEFSNKTEDASVEEGDIRISFHYFPLQEISIIGRLSQGILYPVEDQNENYLYLFESGKKTLEELVDSARNRTEKSNSIGSWLSLGVFLLGLFFFSAPFRHRK